MARPLLAILLMLIAADCAKQPRDPAITAAPAVIMVMAGDWRDGQLVPRSMGSGTIVDADGTVLTSHHLLYDEDRRRLHDRFAIVRAPAQVPVCTGRPARSARDPALDLAVIRCDQDIAGQPFTADAWPAIAIGRADTLAPDDPIWILGYPLSGGGALQTSTGPITGWTGEHGGPGREFFTADAAVAPGTSGGAVVDRTGTLVGVATGYRVRTRISGIGVMPVGRIGLIRPVDRARHLLDAATKSGASSRTKESSPGSLTPSL